MVSRLSSPCPALASRMAGTCNYSSKPTQMAGMPVSLPTISLASRCCGGRIWILAAGQKKPVRALASHRRLSPFGLVYCCGAAAGASAPFLWCFIAERLLRLRIGVLGSASPRSRRQELCSADPAHAFSSAPCVRYPDDIGYLLLAGALTDLDTARVDTLLLYEVSLRIHRRAALPGSSPG